MMQGAQLYYIGSAAILYGERIVILYRERSYLIEGAQLYYIGSAVV